MRIPLVTILVLAGPTATAAGAAEGPVVTSERGTCIEGPHEPLRERRLPGTAVFSVRPDNPLRDPYVHCKEPAPRKQRTTSDFRRPPR
jgi:hypothetical protein